MKTLIRAIIDTAALRHNLKVARERAPGARVMAVIKANAYGHGLVPVAKALAAADGLAVARIDEAVALRAAGLTNRVLLLEGVFNAEQLALAARERFEIMVHSAEQLDLLDAHSGADRIVAWLKVDTGMNRLGFRVEEFPAAYERLRRNRAIVADPVLTTHLANADALEDDKTDRQLTAFRAITDGLPGARSIANSAGLLGWPGTRGDWVRPGIMLYGVSPFPVGWGSELGLRPVMTLQSEVIAIKHVKAGETVGYAGTWRAQRDTRAAVIAAGYGDGYPRSLPSGAPVLVNGRRVPLIGRVSMDMITVDVSETPNATVGAPVVLWGEGLPLEDVARHADTIPYELVCRVSPRVQHEPR